MERGKLKKGSTDMCHPFLGTRNSELGTRNSELGTRNSELGTRNSELGTLRNGELHWVLQVALDRHQKAGHFGAIGQTVIGRKRDLHLFANAPSTVLDNRHLGNRADRQDRRLGRIDDRDELINIKHTQIADGKGPALVFGWLQSTVPRSSDEILG